MSSPGQYALRIPASTGQTPAREVTFDVTSRASYGEAQAKVAIELAKSIDTDNDRVFTEAELQAARPEAVRRMLSALTESLISDQIVNSASSNGQKWPYVVSMIFGGAVALEGAPLLGLLGGLAMSGGFRLSDKASEQKTKDLLDAANFVGAYLEPKRMVAIGAKTLPKEATDVHPLSGTGVYVMNVPDGPLTYRDPNSPEARFEDTLDQAAMPSWLQRQLAGGMWDWGWAGPLNFVAYPMLAIAALAERAIRGENVGSTITLDDAQKLKAIYDEASGEARATIREYLKHELGGRRHSFETLEGKTRTYALDFTDEAKAVLQAIAKSA